MTARVSKFLFPIHVNISNFVTIKLAKDNFLLWQAQLYHFWRSHELIGFVNGEILEPLREVHVEVEGRENEVHNQDYADWLKQISSFHPRKVAMSLKTS